MTQMKIVLSRKGLDSEYGGIPSPIIQDKNGIWKFIPVPIPSTHTNDTRYIDLNWSEEFSTPNFFVKMELKSKKSEYCHLDPDINRNYLKTRNEKWRPNFGQVKSAQSHLSNKGIGTNDVFLFFGWFKKYEYKDGKYIKLEDGYPNGFHAIYGYLQVNKVVSVNSVDFPEWLKYHPHYINKEDNEFNNENNSIYIANENFIHSDIKGKKGANTFIFNEELVLTEPKESRRSFWKLPHIFNPKNEIELSYNLNHSKWGKDGNNVTLKSTCKGQEFVFSGKTEPVTKWCIDLINKYSE